MGSGLKKKTVSKRLSVVNRLRSFGVAGKNGNQVWLGAAKTYELLLADSRVR